MHVHIVQKGDTLWKISRSYDVSFDELKKLNAHLANPEYIVPGMKIFIPETKKMESTRHPYSEERQVKKQMVKKEEVKIQPHQGTNKNYQPTHHMHQTHPHHETHHHHPHHPVHPVHISHAVHPIYKAQPVHPIYKAMPVPVPIAPSAPPVQQAPPLAPPIQQAPPVHTYTMPYHIMPVPEIEMTPSPQGWRLIESTSIHINIHNEDREKEEIKVINEANPINQVQPMAPVQPPPQPQPIPAPPTPQYVSPIMEEPSSEFVPMYPYEPMCQCEQCQSMQSFPYMEPDMQEMQPYGHYPYMPVCYVPVYPCPPHPCPPHPFHHF